MSKNKRVNPRRRPVSVDAARAEGQNRGITCASAIFLTALLDSGFIAEEQLPDVWEAALYLSDSIAKGYVNIHDLIRALREEHGITLEL